MRPIHPTRTNHGAELPPAPHIVEAADGGAYVCDRPGEATADRFRYIAPPAISWDRDGWPTMRVGSADAPPERLDLGRARVALVAGLSVWVEGMLAEARLGLLTATLADLNAALDAAGRTWPLDPSQPMRASGSLHEWVSFDRASHARYRDGALSHEVAP